jgi:dephospho-CoA kinase
MIIGLSGFAQSGKDTVAERLVTEHGFERIAFADPIRKMIYAMNPKINGNPLDELVDDYGWDVAKKNPEVREMLQQFGYAARVYLGEDIWIAAALRKMDDKSKRYVITDVRFLNEAGTIKVLKGKIWRVERPEVEAANAHVSEWEMNAYNFDETIGNDGTVEQLNFLVDTLVNKNV